MQISVPRMNEQESAAWLGIIGVSQLLPAALDAQLQREASLTHFEFTVLTALRFTPDSTLRMTTLASMTNATLPRLSHVCKRMENRGLIERMPDPNDGRATLARLSSGGRAALVRSMPGHIAAARRLVIDALTPEQLDSLTEITSVIRAQLATDASCPPLNAE